MNSPKAYSFTNIQKFSQSGLLLKTKVTWNISGSTEKWQGEDRAGVCPPEPTEQRTSLSVQANTLSLSHNESVKAASLGGAITTAPQSKCMRAFVHECLS